MLPFCSWTKITATCTEVCPVRDPASLLDNSFPWSGVPFCGCRVDIRCTVRVFHGQRIARRILERASTRCRFHHGFNTQSENMKALEWRLGTTVIAAGILHTIMMTWHAAPVLCAALCSRDGHAARPRNALHAGRMLLKKNSRFSAA